MAILLVVGVLEIGLLAIKPHEASAAWFNDSYAYRQKITFTHNADIASERRITITIDTATLISNGKMQSDCDDSRFTDVNGKVLLYQLTGSCNNSATTYDVVVPTVYNGTNMYYLYYGNPAALSASDSSVANVASLSPSGGAPAVSTEEKGTTPVLDWGFDEGAGTTAHDGSQNSNNGTLANGPTWQSEDLCAVGKCLYLDGSDDAIERAYASDTDLDTGSGSFTVSVWFRHEASISAQQTIISRRYSAPRTPPSTGYDVSMNSNGNICAAIRDDVQSADDAVCTTTTYTDNMWHFVSVVKNAGSSLTVLIDGSQNATLTSIINTGSLNSDSPSFLVGATSQGAGFWKGFIDEVKVYAYAKSATQIKTDFANRGGLDQTSTSFGSTNIAASLGNGLVGYWKMDEASWSNNCVGTPVTDSSGNGNNGNACPATNAGPTTAAGKFSNAGNFDGTNDYVDLGTSSSLAVATNFTVGAWVNWASGATGPDTIYSAGSTDTQYWSVAINASSKLEFRVDLISSATYISTNTISQNTWHHIVVTKQGDDTNNVKFYIDGVLDATASAGSLVMPMGTRGIGTRMEGPTEYFQGGIDDLRIYNRALSPSEISGLYNWGPAPAAYWHMNEGTGTSIGDTSGNGNTSSAFGGDTTWAAGKFGSGLTFDGTDDVVRIPETSSTDIGATTDSFTVSAWFTNASSLPNDGILVGKWAGVASGYPIDIRMDSGGWLKMSIGDGTNSPGITTFPSLYNDGQWHIVTAVRDVAADTISLYVDGIKKASATDTTTATVANNDDISIGNGATSYTLYDFTGRMDDVRLYNYARTPKQIISDMNGGHPTVGSPVGSATGQWSFDEGYGTAVHDASPNGNDLTLSSASWTNSGKIGKAWNGTGSNYVSRADDDDFDFGATDDFSVSTWFKSDSTTNPASAAEFLVNKSSASAGYGLYLNQTTGQLSFGVDDDTTWQPDDQVTSTADVYDAQWHHAVGVRKSTGEIYLYIDGVLVNTDSTVSATATLANSVELRMGSRNSGSPQYFNGDLDEVKIYRYALSGDEVKVDFNQGRAQVMGATSTASNGITADNSADRAYCVPGDATSCSAPVGEWKLDEGTGTTANDTSSNANTGMLSNFDTTDWVSGKVGTALNFDSIDNDIAAGSATIVDDMAAFTVSGWIYYRSTGQSQAGRFLDKSSGTATDGWDIRMNNSDSLVFDVDYDGASNLQAISTAALTTNAWQYVTITWDGTANRTGVKFYLNGRLVSTSTGSGTDGIGNRVTDAAQVLHIGNSTSGSRTFDGKFDDIKLYNYARTPAQVAWDYNRGGPVGWWQFDECTGTTAYDASGVGNNGTWNFGASAYTAAGACGSGSSSQMWNAGTTGKFNSAGAFDGGTSGNGDTHVRLPDNIFDAYSVGAISAWFKANDTGSQWQPIFMSAEDDNGAYSDYLTIYFNSTSNSMSFVIRDNASYIVEASSANNSIDTNWHHVVWSMSTVGSTMYLDGKPLSVTYSSGTNATSGWFSNVSDNTTAYTIGCSDADGSDTNDCDIGEMFQGLIDDVRVYNYPLTTAQVKTIYNENSALRFGP